MSEDEFRCDIARQRIEARRANITGMTLPHPDRTYIAEPETGDAA